MVGKDSELLLIIDTRVWVTFYGNAKLRRHLRLIGSQVACSIFYLILIISTNGVNT